MTNTGIFRQRAKESIFAFVLLAAPMAHPAAAQGRPGPAVELTAGWVGFADDGIVSEGLVAGAAPDGICSLESVSDPNLCISTEHSTATWWSRAT
jgi:hypothetical protein